MDATHSRERAGGRARRGGEGGLSFGVFAKPDLFRSWRSVFREGCGVMTKYWCTTYTQRSGGSRV